MADQTIVEFIRQQLDEDERVAKAAEGHSLFDGTGIYIFRNESVGRSETVVIPSHLATYIARWDPARVLREVEAGRRMLSLHSPTDWQGYSAGVPIVGQQCEYCASLCHSRSGLGCESPADALWPCDSVRILALPFVGLPGYREEWRP